MKFWLKLIPVLLLIVGIIYAASVAARKYIQSRNQPIWRTVGVSQGDLTFTVNATGKVQPLHKVSIGAFVSGPVVELLVDFNDRVTQGQLLARIDPKIYEAAVRRDEANLSTRKAELQRTEALLEQAKNDEKRAKELRAVDPNFISDTELDALRFNCIARQADLVVAMTAIEQAKANLENSTINLEYTRIKSPCDGIIVDRKIDNGQTIAASFQTPELFVVAPDLDQWVNIEASVDEADIGLIRQAQLQSNPVNFTVDAYPDILFTEGKIEQVRLSSIESQNVITYPVIVKTPNKEIRLLPGMTANLSFEIQSKSAVVKIPNAALRFYPNKQYVHPEDQAILEGSTERLGSGKEVFGMQSAVDKVTQSEERRNRHVWVEEGKYLRAKAIVTGISNNQFTEQLAGDLQIGDLLVTGEIAKQ